MTRLDAEAFLDRMYCDSKRLFKYKQEFIPAHFINVKKTFEKEYIILVEESTTTIEVFNKEILIKMLMREELVEVTGLPTYSTDVNKLRTGGCECGAWATVEQNCHASWCPRRG